MSSLIGDIRLAFRALRRTPTYAVVVIAYDGGPKDGVTFARHRVSSDYFATLGIRLLRGRGFTRADGPSAPTVAVVSASTARRLWPGLDAVGQRFRVMGSRGPLPPVEVVGVVDDVRFRDLSSDLASPLAMADVYFPFAQATDETIDVAVRGQSGLATLANGLRSALREIDPTLPVFDVARLGDALDAQTASARFGSVILALFAGVATVLTAVGIYGLLAFVVGASRREIAIRMALGAASPRVVRLVVGKGMALAAIGALVGVAITFPSAALLGHYLIDARAADPATIAPAGALIMLAALAASWIPARRASRIAPSATLKEE